MFKAEEVGHVICNVFCVKVYKEINVAVGVEARGQDRAKDIKTQYTMLFAQCRDFVEGVCNNLVHLIFDICYLVQNYEKKATRAKKTPKKFGG